jgi:hypothetical protein
MEFIASEKNDELAKGSEHSTTASGSSEFYMQIGEMLNM